MSDPAASFFQRYDAIGAKRAGTSGDLTAARWLADEIARIPGLAVSLDSVRFGRFVPGVSRLLANEGPPIEGVPLFDGGLTGPDGVKGSIGPLGSAAPIGFAVMEPSMASLPGNAFARERAASRHQAIVIALTTRDGGIAPLNAHDLDHPFGPPVLQVAGRDAGRLLALCDHSAPVQVVVEGGSEPAVSYNVCAEWPGVEPALLLLTPRTSWWTSTAERVGGIWAWHEALRALAVLPARSRRVVGLATCGHELGHIGAHHAFAQAPGLAVDSAIVIHLGANLGTATEPALTVRSNVEGMAIRVAGLLEAAGYPPSAITAVTGGKAGGEAHEIEQRGGRYVSLIGSNPWFHAPEDRWPMSLDRDRTVAIGSAVAALAVELTRRA